MNNKNEFLKAAFEEAAREELEKLPQEDKIIRPYSKDFKDKMNELIEAVESPAVKKRRFGKVAIVAAVLMVLLVFSVSGIIVENFNFDFKNVNMAVSDFEFTSDGAAEDENELKSIIYSGKKIKIRYTYSETDYENEDGSIGMNWPEYGLLIYVDGVRQTFDVKAEGKKIKNTDMYIIERAPGEEKSVEISFEPNIGKAGQEQQLSIVKLYDPDNNFYPECAPESPCHYDEDNDGVCNRCLISMKLIPGGAPESYDVFSCNTKLIMEKDAPEQAPVAEAFSGMKASVLDKRIYDSYNYFDSFDNLHNDFDELRNLDVKIYKDFDESHHEESYFIEELNQVVTNSEWATCIETKAKEQDDIILNLYGQEGRYRVSFYIGAEIQKVFDGCAYADVEIKKGEQVELFVKVDTSKLSGKTPCYVLYTPLDARWDAFGGVNQGLIHSIKIK